MVLGRHSAKAFTSSYFPTVVCKDKGGRGTRQGHAAVMLQCLGFSALEALRRARDNFSLPARSFQVGALNRKLTPTLHETA